jgi:hypothetical protein
MHSGSSSPPRRAARKRLDPQVDEIDGARELQCGEDGGRRRHPEDEADRDASDRAVRGRAPAAEAVPEDERHVRARRDGEDGGDACEREDLAVDHRGVLPAPSFAPATIARS